MQRLAFGTAIGITVSLISCGSPQPQSPGEAFQTTSGRAQHLSAETVARPGLGAEPRLCPQGPPPGVRPGLGALPEAPCTVTGSADILLEPDNPNGQVVHVTVDVSDLTGTNPTGTVSVTELIDHQAAFFFESSDITSIFCVANLQATITGNVDGGGTFTLDIAPSETGGQLAAFYSPVFRAGGPVGNGSFTITGGVTATGPGKGKLQRYLVPPLRILCPPARLAAGPN